MLETCLHMLPWHKKCLLKISQHHHVADNVIGFMAGSCVSWHWLMWCGKAAYPDLWLIGSAIIFWEKRYLYVYKTIKSLFTTFLYQSTLPWHDFCKTLLFMSKRINQHVGWFLANMTCPVVWHGLTNKIDEVFAQHSQHLPHLLACWQLTYHMERSADMVWCWHL